jgi:hypothetical protein
MVARLVKSRERNANKALEPSAGSHVDQVLLERGGSPLSLAGHMNTTIRKREEKL